MIAFLCFSDFLAEKVKANPYLHFLHLLSCYIIFRIVKQLYQLQSF